MTKNLTTLGIGLSAKTMEIIFNDELNWMRTNKWDLIEHNPEFLVALNENRMSIGHVQQIRIWIEAQKEQERIAAEAAAIDARYNLSGL